jgi:hypothetical protein
MQPLKKVLPSRDRVFYVFYDFETMQKHDTLILPGYLSLIWSAYTSFVLVVRAEAL